MFKTLLSTLICVLVFQTGVLAQIYVKSTGVGIGIATPAEKLHVSGKTLIEGSDNVLSFNSANGAWQYLAFNKGGLRNLWMGLDNGTNFHIRNEQPGNIYIQPINGKVVIESSQDNGNIGGSLVLVHPGKTGGGDIARDWAIYNMTGTYGNSLQFWAYSANGCTDMCRAAVTFRDNGSVGIGIFPESAYKLHVNGTVKAATYLADVNPHWPDYVFDTTYRLSALPEVENYVKQNHHLPEVPSAEDVKRDGLNLVDNQATLLKKIEELTLYMIEQNKKIEALNKKIEDQNIVIAAIQKK